MVICAGRVDRARPRRPRRFATAAATAAALLGAGLATGASGQAHADSGDVIVAKSDPRGDVEILPRKGPGKKARQSIDLTSFTMTEQSGGVQMVIGLQRVLTNSRFAQIVEVRMKPGDKSQSWFLDVSMSGQQTITASATYSPDLSGQSHTCSPLVSSADAETDTLLLVVPDACLPTDPAKIRVYSSLVKPSGIGGYALDSLPVRGTYDVS